MLTRTAMILLGSSLRFSVLAALIIAVTVTLVITVWEWLENPGGIFRDDRGTHWRFVYDTAISWLVPTFLQSAATVFVVHLFISVLRHRGKRKRS